MERSLVLLFQHLVYYCAVDLAGAARHAQAGGRELLLLRSKCLIVSIAEAVVSITGKIFLKCRKYRTTRN